jgi:hypothetical protein
VPHSDTKALVAQTFQIGGAPRDPEMREQVFPPTKAAGDCAEIMLRQEAETMRKQEHKFMIQSNRNHDLVEWI